MAPGLVSTVASLFTIVAAPVVVAIFVSCVYIIVQGEGDSEACLICIQAKANCL